MAVQPLPFPVKCAAKFLQQCRVVLFVLGPKHVSVTDEPGVFPVDVETVEIVFGDEGNGAINEDFSAGFGERNIGECAGPGPAPDRYQDFQVRIARFKAVQNGKVFSIVDKTFDNFAVAYIRKGIVDAREFFSRDIGRIEEGILGEDISNDEKESQHLFGGHRKLIGLLRLDFIPAANQDAPLIEREYAAKFDVHFQHGAS
jgi:hypothetical protein